MSLCQYTSRNQELPVICETHLLDGLNSFAMSYKNLKLRMLMVRNYLIKCKSMVFLQVCGTLVQGSVATKETSNDVDKWPEHRNGEQE